MVDMIMVLSTGKALSSGRPDQGASLWSDLHPGSLISGETLMVNQLLYQERSYTVSQTLTGEGRMQLQYDK